MIILCSPRSIDIDAVLFVEGLIIDGFSDCVSEDNCGLNLKSFQCSLICVIHDLCSSAETAIRGLVITKSCYGHSIRLS